MLRSVSNALMETSKKYLPADPSTRCLITYCRVKKNESGTLKMPSQESSLRRIPLPSGLAFLPQQLKKASGYSACSLALPGGAKDAMMIQKDNVRETR